MRRLASGNAQQRHQRSLAASKAVAWADEVLNGIT
jgi:hypothetical protein